MGGHGDGFTTREIGTGREVDSVWVNYDESMSGKRNTVLSIRCEFEDDSAYTDMGVDEWKKLADYCGQAIEFLEGADDEQ